MSVNSQKEDAYRAIGKTAPGTHLEDMASVGVKLDTGKPPMELLDAYALEQVALVLEFGRRKYSAHNWRKGISYGRLAGAALRHVFAFLRGEDNDPESGLPHIAHAMCCLMFLLGMPRTRADMDDRYKSDKEGYEHP